jgi:hypothetical protein
VAAHEAVGKAAAGGRRVALAAEWLLDNFWVIEQQIVLARRHLPPGYSRQLPQLASGPSAGFPRVYDMALELISHLDGRIDAETVTGFVMAYQDVHALKLGELWAFPIMLRLALLENLRRVVSRIARRREERDAAVLWSDRIVEAAGEATERLPRILAELADAPLRLTSPFVEEFTERLQGQGPAVAFILTWLEARLAERGTNATQLLHDDGRTQGADRISMGNSVSSLALINAMNWREFVESASVVERTLREDPSGVYENQDFATRDRYRRVVETVASKSARDESAVAREAVRQAEAGAAGLGTADRRAHVGYALVDHGRVALERAVRARLSAAGLWGRIGQTGRLAIYLGAIVLVMSPPTWIVLHAQGLFFRRCTAFWLLSAGGLIALSALAVSVVNLWVTWIVPPQTLPRLDFSKGIPPDHRTMVVVPTLLTDAAGIQEMLEALEIRYFGNRDANLFFALLTDFHDAPAPSMPADEDLLTAVRSGVTALNERHGGTLRSIFFLFHRPRTWNPHERLFMGYERKRGKLEQLNAFLRGGAQGAFSETIGDVSILPTIKYVLTLDADTKLPRDTARRLVGNLAHPLNRPVYDVARGRVVAGYGILQPRVAIGLESAGRSPFARLSAGEAGLDPYTHEVSDVYQDLFGEGSFVGKGIYDVDAFRAAVEGRFPENLILSHDLLESGYARAGLVTDVELIEEHPFPSSRTRTGGTGGSAATGRSPDGSSRGPGPKGRWRTNPDAAFDLEDRRQPEAVAGPGVALPSPGRRGIAQTGSTLRGRSSWWLRSASRRSSVPSPSSRASRPSARGPSTRASFSVRPRPRWGAPGSRSRCFPTTRSAVSMRSCAPGSGWRSRGGACSCGIPVITSAASPERPWPGITSRCGSAPRPPSRWRSGWPAFGRGSLPPPRRCSPSGSPRRSSPISSAGRFARAPSTFPRDGGGSFEASRAGPGATSPTSPRRGRAGWRPTTCRRFPPRPLREESLRPTWGWRCSPTWRPTTSATSPPRRFCAGPKTR